MISLPPSERADTEERRLAALARYDILDSARENDFDDIVALASEICGTPIAVINLIDRNRQWFKAEIGLGVRETPLETSFCAHAILEQEFMLVPDATHDPRFNCNPLVTSEPGIRFYAGALLRTHDGYPIGTLCVLDVVPRDLTEQQGRALQRLARQVMTLLELRVTLAAKGKSEARFRDMADDAPVMMWVTDPDGQCVYLNRLWYAQTGQSEAEALGFGWLDATHPDDRVDAEATFLSANRDHAPFRAEYRLRAAHGGYRWALDVATPRFSDTGVFQGFIGSVIDIDERKSAEEALRGNENYLRLLLDSTSEGFYSVDREGNTTLCNEAFIKMLGFPSAREVVGRKLHDVIHGKRPNGSPYPVSECPIYVGASTGLRAHVTDEYFYRVDGTALPVEYWVHPILIDGVLQGAICTFIDISERRMAEEALNHLNATLEHRVADAVAERERTEEQLRQSQKIEAIGQLTGGVAHDFNNLLTIIRGSVDLLQRPGLTEARRVRYIEAISDTVTRATKLTGQLLAFARRQALKPETFDVGRSVTAVIDMLSTLTGARIAIAYNPPGDPCFIDADPSQFDTALINMAVNARDAMNGEGQLTISVAAVSIIPKIRSHAEVAGDFVAVSLSDNGTGIEADRLEAIFEPFYTTKGIGEGTGLGLSQVFGFAKQSGGEVQVESALDQGATFTLYLPRVAESAPIAPLSTSGSALQSGDGMCVLLVEDNEDVRAFTTQTLNELGYATCLARNAEEALAELARDATRFDIVFSDVVMPGMNGVDLAKEIRGLYGDMPILLTSGYSHVLAQSGTAGFALLHKPYAVEELSATLQQVAAARIVLP